MASAASLRGKSPFRGFLVGFPGSGKTGALASLANAGYKLRVLDFEGNFQPLLGFSDPRADIDIVTLQDKMKNGDKYVEIVGIPEAFNNANRMMKEWKYTEDGQEINLGKSSEWGSDTIVVVDSLTSLSASIFRRAMKMNNKTPSNITSSVWGHAVADLSNFIDLLKAEENRFHLLIIAHLQILGPADFIQQGDTEEIREKKLEVIGKDMIPTRYYPISVTKPDAQKVHGKLPIMLQFEKKVKLGKDVRVIKVESGPEIDVKFPAKIVKSEYPIETGMADIFTTLGFTAPGLK
jgi:hypothetical protein